jgi:hypothetical protein
MTITNVTTGDEIEVVIEPIAAPDIKRINKSNQFKTFPWSNYSGEVYKLRQTNNAEILGLMLIIDHTNDATNAIEIDSLEVGRGNVGTGKQLDKIAGCLIAFACRESFKRGHDGVIFLSPKSALISHYESRYKMNYIPPIGYKLEGIMVSYDNNSRKLIKQYLE